MGLNNAMIYVDKHWVYYSLCVCVLGGGDIDFPPYGFLQSFVMMPPSRQWIQEIWKHTYINLKNS